MTTQKIHEDEKYLYYLSFFQGAPIRILRDKATNEILFDADQVCQALGLAESLNQFLGTDEGLDSISKFKQKYPDKTLFGENGMIRKI